MTESEEPITMDVKEIMKVIPHRYPFLLVDKIVSLDAKAGVIVGQKNVSINEAFFQGHFPGAPLMPGVLILEALAQVGAVLVFVKGQEDKIGVLLNIKEAKFRNPVKPGDILILKCEGIHFSSKGGRVKAMATVNEKVAVEAEIAFALVDKETV